MVGILALQGGFARHAAVFSSLGEPVREVRTDTDLEGCDRLVLPGGESTVLTRLLMDSGWEPGAPAQGSTLYRAIADFARTEAVMGTCAGLIMLSQTCSDDRVVPFSVLPVTIRRNAYGRQTESFVEPIHLAPTIAGSDRSPFPATFIRAPRIEKTGLGVEIMAEADGHGLREPVLVAYKRLLGLTFHPELNPEDTRIHRFFLDM